MKFFPPHSVSAHLAAITSGLLVWMYPHAPALAFTFDDVAKRAEQLAATSYKQPSNSLPKEMQSLTYDQYRDIRFKPEKAYWRNARVPFELMFFHQGWHFDQPVRINEIAGRSVLKIKFSPEEFDYGKNQIDPKQLTRLGFAGFRVHYALNTPKYKDEVLVFLGASYFRAR